MPKLGLPSKPKLKQTRRLVRRKLLVKKLSVKGSPCPTVAPLLLLLLSLPLQQLLRQEGPEKIIPKQDCKFAWRVAGNPTRLLLRAIPVSPGADDAYQNVDLLVRSFERSRRISRWSDSISGRRNSHVFPAFSEVCQTLPRQR